MTVILPAPSRSCVPGNGGESVRVQLPGDAHTKVNYRRRTQRLASERGVRRDTRYFAEGGGQAAAIPVRLAITLSMMPYSFACSAVMK
jgi:hypothetical protein